MSSVFSRVLAAGLALLLGLGGAPALAEGGRVRRGQKASTQVKGTISIPYVVLHPDTPREVTWFLGARGPLAPDEALTPEEVRAFLERVNGGAPLPALASVADRVGRQHGLEEWEQQLWRDYLAHLGERAALVEAEREDLRPTAEDLRGMALRVALGKLLPALADGLGEELQPERILFAVCSAVIVYLAMWAVPEPISKTLALGITAVMLVAFGAELLAHVVGEWRALVAATASARTFGEVKEAGERFGRAIGRDGARVLMVLASLALGRDLHGLLKRLPRPPASGPALEAALPGGMRVRLPVPRPTPGAPGAFAAEGAEVASITLVNDRFVVAMAAAGGSAGASPPLPGGGSGAVSAACAPVPSSKRLAANMEATGVKRPPGTDAHHIVAANAEAARDARTVLRRFGVDIDDAANGVFLPSNNGAASTAPGSIHSTVHTRNYYEVVNQQLSLARSRQDVLDALEDLRQMLLSGVLP